ncbi:hypothetical protein [Archangium lansingense]|uniref:Uncharacterized protein n=1 Tax=Archangium lansingense TaxID=2995310 RepID=A0ABT4AC35_9BACT|nr:hypothetical protein [Archangium lansinium]MCY1079232.1 hypothetical protein [Archangium lansinium]
MSTYEDLIEQAAQAGVQLNIRDESQRGSEQPDKPLRHQSPAEIIFHTPIIALAILIVSFSEKVFHTGELSRWTANVLAQLCYGSTKTASALEWSIILHARCAEALVFLENASLATVSTTDKRITISSTGREFIRERLKSTEDIGQLLRALLRAHSFVQARGFTLL